MCWFKGQCCKKRQKRLGFGDLMRGKFKVCEARNVTDLGKLTKIAAHLHFRQFFSLISILNETKCRQLTSLISKVVLIDISWKQKKKRKRHKKLRLRLYRMIHTYKLFVEKQIILRY